MFETFLEHLQTSLHGAKTHLVFHQLSYHTGKDHILLGHLPTKVSSDLFRPEVSQGELQENWTSDIGRGGVKQSKASAPTAIVARAAYATLLATFRTKTQKCRKRDIKKKKCAAANIIITNCHPI